MQTNQLIKDSIGWGFVLWLIGYALGIILFVAIPPSVIGWVIMPIGTLITFWVLLKKIKSQAIEYYLVLGLLWTIIAVVFDYLLIVKTFNPSDGYYKLDVYLYYLLTLILPPLVGLWKINSIKKSSL